MNSTSRQQNKNLNNDNLIFTFFGGLTLMPT